MEITQYAPVLIPTLNRHVHFKRCVESLAACTHADKTELYIAFDYPLKEEHFEGYNIIKSYLTHIKGFKKVHIITREENFGPYKNFHETLNDLFKKHDRLIFSEDDNFFSPHFLSYMNYGLTKYEKNSSVYSIVGWSPPIHVPDNYAYDVYFFQSGAAWGIAFWKDKYIDTETMSKAAMKNDRKTLRRIKKTSSMGYYVLLEDLNSDKIYSDARILYLMHKHNMFAVFPLKTLVQNTGHDGTGVHCGFSDKYIDNKPDLDFIPKMYPNEEFLNKEIFKQIRKQKSITYINELKKCMRTFIKNTIDV